ncbi:nitroreductase family protein [Cryptosporangium sp. NPDC051539]|uniref:nitroreductase family protein n=1 Tax=Cryptosporangium sp. NPDC051539 TaxID=3363962 RepID=UPI00378FD699
MEFAEILRKRRMTKVFSREPVSEDVVERILRAANRGPSAGFSQGYALLVLTELDDRVAFWRALGQHDIDKGDPVKRAPVIVVPLASKQLYVDRYKQPDKGWSDRDDDKWPVPYWYIDTGFTALLMMLAAVDEEIGAQFFGILPPVIDEFRMQFGVPDTYRPIGAVAIGHRDERLDSHPMWKPKITRKPLDEIVHRGKW